MKLKNKVTTLTRRMHRVETRYYRLKKSTSKISNSPRSVLNRDLKSVSKQITPEVRKKLLFAVTFASDVKHSYARIKSHKVKRLITDRIDFKYVKKYRFLSVAKPFFSFEKKNRVVLRKGECGHRHNSEMELVKKLVREFYEDDGVSTVSPNKNDTITRKKVKKQKRFLQNSLKYLFIEFCEKSSFVLSYSLFCKLRPFWVLNHKISARDTCLCVRHENMKLLCQKLRQLKVINDGNIDILLKKEMCCTQKHLQESCLFRECVPCYENMILFNEFDGEMDSYYETWKSVEEEGRDGKMYKRTAKTRVKCKLYNMVSHFENLLIPYMKHLGYIRHQYKEISALKNSIDTKSLLVHIDFSENYQCKYCTEIQSVHFGGNRVQVTLHTGVMYHAGSTECFCTISPDLTHDPIAILKHLEPILFANRFKDIENLHFLSDSPATQYRNQFMFFILKKYIIPRFTKSKKCTWNYTEAAHGKGAPDGVGSTMKNTCDRIVSYGVKDIATFKQFAEVVQKEIVGIKIVSVDARDEELKKFVRKNAIALKGSMQIHQVVWSREKENSLFFNTLSCFTCHDKCQHYGFSEINYPKEGAETSTPAMGTIQESVSVDDDSEELCIEERLPEPEVGTIKQSVSVDDDPEELEERLPASAMGTPEQSISVSVGDFVIAQFPMAQESRWRRFIGCVLETKDGCHKTKFLNEKRTQQKAGFVYVYANHPYIADIESSQIVKKLPAPKIVLRGAYLFDVSHTDLKAQ